MKADSVGPSGEEQTCHSSDRGSVSHQPEGNDSQRQICAIKGTRGTTGTRGTRGIRGTTGTRGTRGTTGTPSTRGTVELELNSPIEPDVMRNPTPMPTLSARRLAACGHGRACHGRHRWGQGGHRMGGGLPLAVVGEKRVKCGGDQGCPVVQRLGLR